VAGARGARYIKEHTTKSYRKYAASLCLFFGETPLDKIHIGHLRQYQEARVTGSEPFIRYRRPQDAKPHKRRDGTITPAVGKTPCPASPKKANQELSVLRMVLRRAGCWAPEMDEYYTPFQIDEMEVPRSLSVEEQKLWLDVANCKPRWHCVYWYSVLAFDTGMSTNEIRALRIGDVDLHHRIINIPAGGAKNKFRQRPVTIDSADCLWAVEQLGHRARDLGSTSPQNYLFPFRRKNRKRDDADPEFDPNRPMTESGIRKCWNEVRDAANLKWFRPYDTRHTALTRWAENGVPPAVIQARAGHVNARMMRVYIHISQQVQRKHFQQLIPGERFANQPFYLQRRA
jgi:integrase